MTLSLIDYITDAMDIVIARLLVTDTEAVCAVCAPQRSQCLVSMLCNRPTVYSSNAAAAVFSTSDVHK